MNYFLLIIDLLIHREKLVELRKNAINVLKKYNSIYIAKDWTEYIKKQSRIMNLRINDKGIISGFFEDDLNYILQLEFS